jgi:hypothetical protein
VTLPYFFPRSTFTLEAHSSTENPSRLLNIQMMAKKLPWTAAERQKNLQISKFLARNQRELEVKPSRAVDLPWGISP